MPSRYLVFTLLYLGCWDLILRGEESSKIKMDSFICLILLGFLYSSIPKMVCR